MTEDQEMPSDVTVNQDQTCYSYYGGIAHVLGIDRFQSAELHLEDEESHSVDEKLRDELVERLALAGLELRTYSPIDGKTVDYLVLNLEAADVEFGLAYRVAIPTLEVRDRMRNDGFDFSNDGQVSDVLRGYAERIDNVLADLEIDSLNSQVPDNDSDARPSFLPDGTFIHSDWPELSTRSGSESD